MDAQRITPADAGKTAPKHYKQARLRDHPRGCGENKSGGNNHRRRSGSPPRMRGKLSSVFVAPKRYRITPADAGKTRNGIAVTTSTEDHPRGCGENFRPCGGIAGLIGSPPRMRGKQFACGVGRRNDRITPADAGKTQLKTIYSNKTKDHPRGCGENSAIRTSGEFNAGSPPRMRGKLVGNTVFVPSIRITPADAGKTGYSA